MCAVVGATAGYDLHKVLMLFKNSRIRGLHAFGYAYTENGEVHTSKFLEYEDFVDTFSMHLPKEFIAHFRYSTSGDWRELDNNQPIKSEGRSLVFNGTIDMRTKKEMEEAYKITLNTDNDGELVLLSKDPVAFINENGRTFAGLLLDKDRNITPLRNELRPLYFSKNKEVTYYASTLDIMNRSGFQNSELVGTS